MTWEWLCRLSRTTLRIPTQSTRRNLSYVFTPKHHGASKTASCWQPAMTLDEEFTVFDRADGIVVQAPADDRQVADADGNIYGYTVLADGTLDELGTWYQQLAEFPAQAAGAVWHGYPIRPIGPLAPQSFQGQKCRPNTSVFDRMFELGDITNGQRKLLKKGEWV